MKDMLISYLPREQKKIIRLGKRDKDQYSASSIYYPLFETAERLSEQAFHEQDINDKISRHNNVPVAICAYINALDAYWNSEISFRVQLIKNKDEIPDLINTFANFIAKGMDTKLDEFYELCGLEKSAFKHHEDVKIMAGIRNEINHFMPYMVNRGECPKRIASALNKASIKFENMHHWSHYLCDLRVLKWARTSFKAYIDELSEVGFHHLDSKKYFEKIKCEIW